MPPTNRASSTRAILAACAILTLLCATAALLAIPQKANALLTDGLVGHWTFNGADVTANHVLDKSGQGNHGGFFGGATSSAKVQGKLGQALNFDGTNDLVNVGSGASLDNIATITISAWIKPNANSDGGDIFDKVSSGLAQADGPDLWIDPSGGNRLYFTQGFYDGLFNTGVWYADNVISLGEWQHVAVVYSSQSDANDPVFYVNGIPKPTIEDQAPSGDQRDDSAWEAVIGAYGASDTNGLFDGLIDDIRVYNRALTAAEIKQLYNLGKALQKPPNNLGLVGYWSFNEGTGTRATDFSGNGRTGTLQNQAGWVSGKRGKALRFDGDGDYVTMGDVNAFDGLAAITVSAWVKSTNGVNDFPSFAGKSSCGAGENGPFLLFLASDSGSGPATFAITASGGDLGADGTTDVDDGNWHFIVGRYDGSLVSVWVDGTKEGENSASGALVSTGNAFEIGGNCNSNWKYYNGIIDEVRIYSRALGPTEIAALAGSGSNRGSGGAVQVGASSVDLHRGSSLTNGLAGHWTFDGPDITTTVTDRSGSGNHGGFLGGATSSAKSQGKLGQALSFDGTDDYVSVGNTSSLNLTTSGTVAAWVKRSSMDISASPVILSKFDWQGDINGYILAYNGIGEYRLGLGTGVANQMINFSGVLLDAWQFVAFTWDGSFIRKYIEGNEVGSPTAQTLTPDASSQVFLIGKDDFGSSHLHGSVDDVRIYNRALTAAEIKQLYKLGQTVLQQ